MAHNELQSHPFHHNAEILVRLFNDTFFEQYNTRLEAGEDEPVYLPADETCAYHRIVFAHGFFSSALHEVAHWCVAGEERRKQVDYGYWYEPDGRNTAQQAEFQKVEVKPQAIEWAFSMACGHPFNVSLDNLNGETTDSLNFSSSVAFELSNMLNGNFPPRAERFIEVLRLYYFPSAIAKPLSRAHRAYLHNKHVSTLNSLDESVAPNNRNHNVL